MLRGGPGPGPRHLERRDPQRVTPTRSRTAIGWTRKRSAVDDLDEPRRPMHCPPSAMLRLAFTRRMAKLGYHYDDVRGIRSRPMAEHGQGAARHPWEPMPRWPCSKREAALASSTTSTSCSRRSRTRRSTPLRESVVTSSVLYIGNHGNLLEDCRDTCRLIRLERPDALARRSSSACAPASTARASTTASLQRAPTRAARTGPARSSQALSRTALKTRRSRPRSAPAPTSMVLSDRAGEGEVPIPSPAVAGQLCTTT